MNNVQWLSEMTGVDKDFIEWSFARMKELNAAGVSHEERVKIVKAEGNKLFPLKKKTR